jgi:hypothetical protein
MDKEEQIEILNACGAANRLSWLPGMASRKTSP